MLKLKNITKSFGDNEVLKDINLNVKKGEVYGLIGANGAGKTTLFNIIAQIIKSDCGQVFINDEEIRTMNDLAQKIGYIIDIPAMHEYMSAYEYLEFLYSPANKTKVEVLSRSKEILQLVGLGDVGSKRIKSFSRGMKQRMGIAAGLIFNPQLILMDEPSSALDPQGRFEVLKIIEELKNQGNTIILSTHILNDIERVCDRVGLLVNGNIIVEGSIFDVLNKYNQNILKITANDENANQVANLLKKQKLASATTKVGDGIEVKYKNNDNKKEIIKAIIMDDIDFDELRIKRSTLEDIFLLESNGGTK